MIVKLGETKNLTVKESTVDGILCNIYAMAAAVNTSLVAADFLKQEVTLKVILKRDKANKVIAQDNLLVLGLFSALNYGEQEWSKGTTLVYKDVAVKEQRLQTLYIPFGGPINIKGTDELIVEMVVGRAAFGANVDAGVSYIEFNPNYAIGYEYGTPMIKAEVLQANITKQKFSLGDNVTKIAFLNFDQTGLDSQVINSLQLSSDKVDMSLNFFDLFNRHRTVLLPPSIQHRYFGTLPSTTEAFQGLPDFPQSVIVHASDINRNIELDNCSVDISTNSANVAASQNYLVWICYETTQEMIQKAENRREKHTVEKLGAIPVA